MIRFLITLVFLVCVAAGGCEKSPRPDISESQSAVTKGSKGGIAYEVHGRGSIVNYSNDDRIRITFEKELFEIDLKTGRVQWSGKNFGVVKPGDSILVGADGKVLVNGAARLPDS